MSEFTFDLNSLSGVTGSIGSFEAGLSANTPDDKLTYSGKDPIVWDRVNNERLRRGLSPLPNPRPVDDGKTYGGSKGNAPTNTGPARELTPEEKAKAAAIAKQFGVPDPTAISSTFTLSGPPGMTREQAFEIFKKQANAGGLDGFSPGDVLSAQTQAKDGLAAAKAELSQGVSGFPGTDAGVLNSFKSIADTAKQSIAAGTTGTSLTGAVGVAGGILQDTAGKINSLVGAPPVDGISTADFAKTASALSPMANLGTTDVRATVAAVGKATGQDFTQFTSDVGVGKFGFDATQLETAGLVKPGTASKFLSQGSNDLSEVLKSPAVWTGKGGINNLDSLLSNPAAQNFTQQDLMSKGLSSAQSLGIPVDGLNPKDLGGIAANFGKSTAEGADWIRGQLPADKQADFDKRFSDAKFAIGTAEQKLNEPVKQEAPPGEAENTVNRVTVDAAATRVVGNDKIPSVSYGTQPANEALVAENKLLRKEVRGLLTRLQEFSDSGEITDSAQADARNAQLSALANEFSMVRDKIVALKARALNAVPYSPDFMIKLEDEINDIGTAIALINDLQKYLRQVKRRAQAQAG
jgi:hypothetical protein